MGVRLASHAGGRERRFPSVLVEVDGVFDLSSAHCVSEAVLALHEGANVLIDFTRAGGVQDCALARIATALASTASHLHTRGLTHHQVRLLRYLGIDTPVLAAPGDGATGAVA